jgi:outer membrane receptor protein involved in Fe transport
MRSPAFISTCLWAGLLCGSVGPLWAQQAPAPAPASPDEGAPALQTVTVTAERLNLIGTAVTASQGVVVNDELALTPAFRPGQLLETVPGLTVTSHSGEGKANQYMMRGYNLDHGTDFAVSVDGMPVNEPTHAHGQGYADLNFLIPELATGVSYTKGTYYADAGDFASVGSVHVNYRNTTEDQVSAAGGMFGFQRLYSAGSTRAGEGDVLGALELQHYDGPWTNPDDQRKVNAVIRYSEGIPKDGLSLTAMFYHGLWNATTDQPERAVSQGLIGRFGSLDPSDGGQAQRGSLSAQYRKELDGGSLSASAYLISNQLTLWNNFTHFLTDPVHGDQEAQHEERWTVGGDVSIAHGADFADVHNDVLAGLHTRFDSNDVSHLPTEERMLLDTSDVAAVNAPLGFSERDHVHLASVALFVQATTIWTEWFRSVLGLREDYLHGSDSGTNYGTASGTLAEPKVSLIFTPTDTTELYMSWGRGFHSDDLRGVNQARISGVPGAPLLASQTGEELGFRRQIMSSIALTLSLYNLDAQSETTYDPDAGMDSAGPASRRYGVELNVTYQPLRWLEIYASYSANHARFRVPYDDGTGHVGEYLPNAPFAAGSLNIYVKNLGRWQGGLEYRYVSAFPLSSDNVVQGHGYGEWSGDAHYALPGGWDFALGLYNILNTHADAAEFWYVDRLPGEPAGGVADVHAHPLEPFSFRVTISKSF